MGQLKNMLIEKLFAEDLMAELRGDQVKCRCCGQWECTELMKDVENDDGDYISICDHRTVRI